MNVLVKFLLSAVAVIIAAYLLPGAHVDSFLTAFIVAVVLALINLTFRPLFIILTLPITILTLGLFIFVINTFIILIAAKLIDGFNIDGFWTALLFSVLLTLLQSMFNTTEELTK